MRPFWISTIASMSPCRDVPRPRYTPSLYVVLAAVLAAGAAAGGAGDGAGVVVACTGGGALGAAAGAATTGGVTATDTGALTTGGGAVSTVATGADTGVAPAGVETVAPAAGGPITAAFDGAGAVATPAGGATALDVLGSDAAAGASTTATAGVAETIDPPDSPAAVRPPTAPAPARDALRGRRSALSAAMRSAAGFVFAKPAVYTISTAAEPSATRLLPRALDTRGDGRVERRGNELSIGIYGANARSAAPIELPLAKRAADRPDPATLFNTWVTYASPPRIRSSGIGHRNPTVAGPTTYSPHAVPMVPLRRGPDTPFPMRDNETPLAELERLRLENARLRAQLQHAAPSEQPGQHPFPPVAPYAGDVPSRYPRVSRSRRWMGRAFMGVVIVVALVTAALFARRIADSDVGDGIRDGWQEGNRGATSGQGRP